MRKMVRVMRALGVASLLLAYPTFGQGLVKSANHPGPWSVSVLGVFEHTDGRMDAAFEVMSNPSVRADKFVGAALSYQVARFWRDFTADLEFGAGRRFAGSGLMATILKLSPACFRDRNCDNCRTQNGHQYAR